MPVTKKLLHAGLLLLVGALTLTGCKVFSFLTPSAPAVAGVDWNWDKPVQFTTEAVSGKKVFIEWSDLPVVREISANIKKDIASVLVAKHKLEVTEKSEDADYIIQLYLRYFSTGDANGRSVRESAGEIGGGRPEWLDENGPISGPKAVERIPDSTRGNSDWVLVVDVAVGEKNGDKQYEGKMALRQGRLIGCLPCRGLTHDDVLWYFKYGKPYPVPPEPVDGFIPANFVPPDQNQPADELLDVLIPGILPLVN